MATHRHRAAAADSLNLIRKVLDCPLIASAGSSPFQRRKNLQESSGMSDIPPPVPQWTPDLSSGAFPYRPDMAAMGNPRSRFPYDPPDLLHFPPAERVAAAV